MVRNKVILVNPALHFQKPLSHGMYPNTAVMVLATILNQAGFTVKIIDGRYQKIDQAVDSILAQADESMVFIGFSVMTVQLAWVYRVSQAIKTKLPQKTIIWGGVHPTLFPEQTIEDPAVDIVVVDGATSLAQKLSKDEDLSLVNGILYKDNSRIKRTPENLKRDSFHNIPFIDFELINHKKYSQNNNITIEEFYGGRYRNCRIYPLITGLGCSYRCTFCINVILNKKYVYRSAQEMVERIKFLKEKYGASFHPHYG